MPDEHSLTLQELAADRDWWFMDAGVHYRELAGWLREIAVRCRLPYTRRELLSLAKRYERRADHLTR